MPPVLFQWDGDAMVPIKRHAELSDREFVVHEYCRMAVVEGRSWKSHKHFFAALFEGWANLPERYALEPWSQSDKHLRRYALIKTGWHDSQTFACGSQAEALRWAVNMRPLDEYSIIVAITTTVVRYTAKSQSITAMGAKDFKQSKNDVLDFIADLVGVDRGQLEGSAA